MDSGRSVLGLPPLPKQPSTTPPASIDWKNKLFSQASSKADFNLSFIPPSSPLTASFSSEDIQTGVRSWDLSLIGYALGKRPFYGSLLAAVKKKWAFKGSFDLLTLEGDFFLFKFNCKEDYDMVWNLGICFLLGKPFVFKRWEWDFKLEKDPCEELPIWIKLPNLPLCCWTEVGFSKLASLIGTPIAVDALTAAKSRLTFARICVQWDSTRCNFSLCFATSELIHGY